MKENVKKGHLQHSTKMSLEEYREKRKFSQTPEPDSETLKKPSERLHFVVQKHAASHMHYDFRLEMDGVLKSWAVPKGPSLNPQDKRLAMMVEDHPLPYEKFEGIIPKGNYGAGIVMIWDKGIYFPLPDEESFKPNLHKGSISFFLVGKKLQGEFSLVKLTDKEDNSWLLIKKPDEFASEERVIEKDLSAVSGKSLEQIVSESERTGQIWPPQEREGEDVDLTGTKIVPMPHAVSPMLSTLAKEPFDKDGWIFEIKWDGYRAIAELEGDEVTIYSRKKQSFNQRFSPLVDELRNFPIQAIFDGEIVVLDKKGKPQFQLLQNYSPSKGNLVYYVFDLLYFNGHDLTGLPLLKRKSILEKILPASEKIRYSKHIENRGKFLFEQAKSTGLEGIIAKNSFSVYHYGQRSQEWLKIKSQNRQEAIIGGFTEGKGSRKHFGALVLGVYENGELVYIGHTGGGFNEVKLAQIKGKLLPLVTKVSPFKNPPKTNTPVTWVKPELVAEVAFSEWTEDYHMRHPIFLGLREDKDSRQVSREIAKTQTHREPAFANEISLKERTKTLVDGKHLSLTNLEKVYWPDEKYTKSDLIDYYDRISEFILPYLKDRPESLLRFPDGIRGESFWQKNVDKQVPDWISTIKIHSDSEGRDITYILCQDRATLIFLANLGCIDFNPWSSRIQSLEHPDYLILDLDPHEIDFSEVVFAAKTIHNLLERINVPNFCKTSGATGLHIYIPLGANYSYDQTRQFSEVLAHLVHQRLPKTTSLERSPSKRKRKVYLDYLQNRRGQTLASPYSVRPKPLATVSTPLKWEEVSENLDPQNFTIKTIFSRLELLGDVWSDFFKLTLDMEESLEKISELGV